MREKFKGKTPVRWEVIKILYQNDITGTNPFELLKSVKKNKKEVEKYLRRIYDNLFIIDEYIKKYSRTWDFDRILPLDKAILRFAIGELLFFPSVPSPVVIEEALKIAKEYSSDNSVSFINAICDKVNKEVRK